MTEDPARTPGNAGGRPPPFAARYGLVRPLQGRYFAGVCAALGRATNTDPVLWRVVLAVLVCFGGVGALIYLALWLVVPEEGDTGSPAEAMFGRGHSNTSPVLVVVLGAIAAVLLVFALTRPFDLVLLGGAVILAAVVLLNRSALPAPPGPPQPAPGPHAPGPGAPGPYTPGPYTAGPYGFGPSAPGPAPSAPVVPAEGAPGGAATTTFGVTAPTGRVPGATGLVEPSREEQAPAVAPDQPAVPGPSDPGSAGQVPAGPGPAVPGATGYRPPLAPRGPFGGPPPPPSPPPPAPRPVRERSALPVLVLSVALVVLGALGGLDLAGILDVPAAGYVAAALAVVGGGLVTGAWLGRARSLIALGVVLSVALPVAHALGTWEGDQPVATDITWAPTSAADLEDGYQLTFGEGLLDLRRVDFTGQDAEVAVEVTGGEIVVLLPPEVDVTADAAVFGGHTVLFGREASGFTERSVTDPGSPGTEGGTLVIEVRVTFGNVEVRR